ncbi:MAG: PAS domain S-box protein [Desulfobacter postgatei]|uniref:hybrid sensor histidine kinase/response regulator n=1 Tax=Desulfobacter postgatei TaxID=2293 RepID=UPI0023F31641|nr:PAS domain S-box protein [Desulfobacter postgatei]MDD4274030.1 PAS domain S-box protein [Desulfobacter postgatei]
MKKESMLLPKKSYSLLNLITGSVVITISLLLLPGAWYIQTSFEDKLEIEKLEDLNQINACWASDVDRWLTDAKSSILRFSTLMSNLPESENPDNVALFDTIVEPGEDGSFRSNRESFSPASEAGIWIPKGPSLDSGTKNFFVQANKVTQYFGQGALSNFKDTWILPRQGGIIIFWPDEPEWIYEATKDLDYASSQWVTLTRPDRNPQGLPQLTRASYDPAPGVWMLSIIAPYYRKGKWAGAVGHDFPISGLARQMEGLKLHHGTTQFVIRRDGTLLISDQFSKDIKASNGHFQIEDTHDDALKNVFKASVNHFPLTFPDNIVRDGDQIFMIHHIQEADSLFITIIPEEALLTLVRKSYRAIWMLGGLALLLLTLIPVVVISRMVLPPVNRLVSGIKKVSEGNLGYRFAQSGSKELCYISDALDNMVRRISSSIAEDKQKEASLRKSEERFRHLFQMAPLPLIELSKDGRAMDINACFTEILGYTIEDIPTIDDWSEKVYPDPEYRKQVMTTWHAMVEQAQKENIKIQDAEYQVVTKDGSARTLLIGASLIFDRILLSLFDITDRKKTEEKLRQSEEKFSKIFSMTPCFVAITGLEDGNFIEVNNGFEDMTGWKKDEVLGRTSTEIDLWKTPGSRSDMVAALKAGKDVFNKEVQFKHKDGSPRTGLFSVRLIRLSGVLSILSIIQDITEIKKMEENQQKLQNQLFQSQKMEAIGILAGGIAHDFNNILSALFGFTQLAKMEAGDNETLKKYLDSVSTAGLRARDLVSHILTFSRKSDVKKQKIFLNPIVKETLKFIRASLPSNIRIHQDLRVKRAKIMGDVTQIHQMLMNLFTNAGHAMKNKGGKLEVVLDMISINQTDTMQFNKIKPGRYYCLIISDTGCGIPHAIIDRIFEPFFTTKNREDGTGMGLSTVFGILKEMEGGISVYSEEGIGTTFKVLIPVHEQNGPLDTTRLEDKPISGEGNILIVDDEDPIVQSSQAILSSLGYSVTGTTSSREALKQIEKQPNFFDLVLTDMTMPEMDGLTLSRRIKSINPEIPIVLCTGFSHGLTKEMCRSIGIFDMIMKPMIAGELSKAVYNALKKSPGKETNDSRSDH